ncbi:MAG: ATP-binding protein [Solirubrobacteraceae bacterium]
MDAADTDEVGLGASRATAPLVGRERELGELEAALADAHSRHGQLYLMVGEPGIGKTRLAEAAAERGAAQGMLALWGRAWDSGGAPAYWPWVQVLRKLVATRDAARLETELGGGASWLVEVMPELGDRLPGIAPRVSSGSEEARFAFFDALASFLRNAADSSPLVIVLDDLHAADPASLLLLEFVARGTSESPVLILGTYQPTAARRRPDVEKLIGALARDCPSLILRGFDEQDVGRLVEDCTGQQWPQNFLKALHATTEGNPFFTVEVARLMSAGPARSAPADSDRRAGFPLPDTVRDTIRRRFESLRRETISLLEVAAVIGREFRVSTLRRVAGQHDDHIALLDEAVSADLVTEVTGSVGRFRFRHSLVRETLYAGLGTARRIQLHRAVGEALESRYGGAPEHLVELAHHFAEAAPEGDASKALDYAVKAAEDAMRLFAYEQAATLYELALSTSDALPPERKRDAQLLLALGQARARADHLASRDTLIAAAQAAREVDDPRLFASAGLAMRAFPLGSGVLDDQPSGLLSEALERLDEADSPLRAEVLARLAVSLYYWPGTEPRRMALAEEAVAMARRLDDPAALAHVLSNAQLATWGPDTTERDLTWMEEVLRLTDRLGDDQLELAARNRQIDFLVELNDLRAAERALSGLALTVTRSSDPRTAAYVRLHRARHAIIEGRYADAERLNAEASEDGSRLRDPLLVELARGQRFSLRWAQGQLDQFEAATRQAISTDVTSAWRAALALLCCEVGHEGEASRHLERLAANDFRDLPRYNGWLATMGLLSEVCVRLGDRGRGQTIYELLVPFAARNVITPQAAFAGPVARFLGILAGAQGEWELAATHLAEAREAAARMGSPPTLMRVDLDEAQLLIARARPGDRERAFELVDQATSIAQELRTERIAEQVERWRAAIGATARPKPAAAEVAAPASLRREGDVWAFEFDGRSVRVRDSKGVRCLAVLLANPGTEIHAVELAGPGAAREPAGAGRAGAGEPGLTPSTTDDAGPLLDAEAKAAYRRRLEELREDLEEAESFNDPERAAKAREEMDFLASELAGAVGLGGRDRKAASNTERARISVTKAIRATIKRLGKHDAVLGRELEATIRTGTFCMYEPDPRRPLAWRLEVG